MASSDSPDSNSPFSSGAASRSGERVSRRFESILFERATPDASEYAFDLLIAGHHHEARAGRLLLRGVAMQLVGACPMPVLGGR
jgi:nucleotide-binding universal stress UspA family protein